MFVQFVPIHSSWGSEARPAPMNALEVQMVCIGFAVLNVQILPLLSPFLLAP